ncbi:ZIP family metal transporter [Mycolicibacterium pyrenivorans]|uniref:ZIP family metal transporter n=1 Tax=Mycolicibacterium pyrenivorans TaxID=187102 RepID=UPI0021F39DB6|nr:ZIP family metal transporter [Mycolicibacterium pyrenivorans]MCV7151479.1 ZIP family metal transporter [Mycolicibacterium pyrenivorans]
MSVLGWIVLAGLAMSALALVGSGALLIPERLFSRVVMPLVALAAGALIGGALFHMLPESIAVIGNHLSVYAWVAAGILSFHVLEQFLHWHHCHRPIGEHRPLGYLILAADGLHNLIGGVAVGSAFIVDIRLGIVTWVVAAAHEIPQELGDFGILVHSGWSTRHALLYNAASALTFPLGGLLAYGFAGRVDVAVLVPFAAGNFIYIALADLLPEITTSPGRQQKIVHTASFAGGLALLWTIALVA